MAHSTKSWHIPKWISGVFGELDILVCTTAILYTNELKPVKSTTREDCPLDFVDMLKELINHSETLPNISMGCDGDWFLHTSQTICGCRLTFHDLIHILFFLTQTIITQVGKRGLQTSSVKLYRHTNMQREITLISITAKSCPLLLFPI